MSDIADIADTRDQEPTGSRRFPWRWVIAAVVLLLITIIAMPLKLASDCQQVLSAARAAGGDVWATDVVHVYPLVGLWPSEASHVVKQFLPPAVKCLDPNQHQMFDFDETAAISDEWLLKQNISAIPCAVRIRIRHPEISDVGIQSLGSIANLIDLSVPRTSLTDEGIKAFRGHPSLTNLRLHRTQVTSASLPVLRSIPNLRALDVSCTDIAGDELRQLRMCPELKGVFVDAGQLTEPFLSSLSTFPKLTALFIIAPTAGPATQLPEASAEDHIHTVLNDRLLQRLLKETTITMLWIEDGSSITDASVPAFLKARHLDRLDSWDVGMSAEGANKVNSVHQSCYSIGGTKPAVRLPGESTVDRDAFASRNK